MQTEIITRGLSNVSPQVTKLLTEPYDSDATRNLASILGKDISSVDNMKAAGRLAMWDATQICSNNFSEYCESLAGRLSKELIKFGMEHIAIIEKALNDNRERNYISLDYLAAGSWIGQILLRPSYDEDPCETPLQSYMRQAIQLHSSNGIKRVLQCFLELVYEDYTNSSPIMFNAGTLNAQMISCFKKVIKDDLHYILYEGVGDCGMISKGNGGLGISLQLLRHSAIGTSGVSSGVLPFARIYDRMIACVNQGGQRDGAATFFLRIFHIDIREFILSKDPTTMHHEQVDKAGICVWSSGILFKRLEKGDNITLFCPAKTKSLNSMYNYEMEVEYVKYEKLAIKRDAELKAILVTVAELKNKLLSDRENSILRKEYTAALATMRIAKKQYIEHKVVKAEDLYKTLTQTQIRSGKVYIMHSDAINYKTNMKNIGSINLSNLCLEITLPSTYNNTSSCNLSSSNLRRHVIGKLDWRKEEHSDSEICSVYNFAALGRGCQSQVENLTMVVKNNKYPIDEHDADGKLVKMGDIHATNIRDFPLGIGVSGQFEVMTQIDTYCDAYTGIRINKMIYACMYFNTLCKSVEMAIKEGCYSTFRTGTYQKYTGVVLEQQDEDGVWHKIPQMQTMHGSPLSNGQLNFDLWKEYAQLLSDMGDLDEDIYDRSDDEELDPSTWGQKSYVASEGIVIEPTWHSLRQAIMTYGVRHSQLLAIMPTASSAQRFGNSESTEIPQAMIYSRKVTHGSYPVVVEQMVYDLQEFGFWNADVADFILSVQGSVKYIKDYILDHHMDFPAEHFVHDGKTHCFKHDVEERLDYLIKKYRNAYEYSQKLFIIQARQRGIYVCQSQSLNIAIRDPTEEQLSAIHSFTYKIGLKTGMYYLRQDPAKAIGNFNIAPEALAYRKVISDRYPDDTVLARLCGIKDEGTKNISKADIDKLNLSVTNLMASMDLELSPEAAKQIDMIRNISEGMRSESDGSDSSSSSMPTCERGEDGIHACCQ